VQPYGLWYGGFLAGVVPEVDWESPRGVVGGNMAFVATMSIVADSSKSLVVTNNGNGDIFKNEQTSQSAVYANVACLWWDSC